MEDHRRRSGQLVRVQGLSLRRDRMTTVPTCVSTSWRDIAGAENHQDLGKLVSGPSLKKKASSPWSRSERAVSPSSGSSDCFWWLRNSFCLWSHHISSSSIVLRQGGFRKRYVVVWSVGFEVKVLLKYSRIASRNFANIREGFFESNFSGILGSSSKEYICAMFQ